MSQEAVHEKLLNGERIIHIGGTFEVSGKSLTGTKEIYLTSQGRVFAYDSGGLFSSGGIHIYDQQLAISAGFQTLILQPENSSHFQFEIEVNLASFKEILKKIPFTCLVFGMDSDFIKRDEVDASYVSTQLSYDASHISFKKSETTPFLKIILSKIQKQVTDKIPFFRIKKVDQIDSYTLILHGFFQGNEQPYHKIEIVHWDENKVRELRNSIDCHTSLYDLVSDENELYTCKVNGLLAGQKINSKHMILAISKFEVKEARNIDKRKCLLSFLDEDSQSLVDQIDLVNCDFYVEEQENRALILNHTSSFYAELPDTAISYLKQGFEGNSPSKWNFQCAELSGLLDGRKFSKRSVSLAFEPNSIMLIYDLHTRDICKVKIDNHATLVDNKSLFIISSKNNYISVIQFFEHDLIESLPFNTESFQLSNVGIKPDQQPFLIRQSKEQIEFAQSNKDILLKIPNTSVDQILVIEQPVDGSDFLQVEIRDTSGGKYQVYMDEDCVKRLIKQTFQHVKMPVLSGTSNEDVFLSWSRSINDFVLYNMFQDILTLQSLVKKIHEKDNDSREKHVTLANGMFHSIKLIKRNLDRIATQIPVAIDNMERSYFFREQVPYGTPFQSLQMGLVMVANQMKGYLMEIEGQLAPVHFAIIPRVEPELLLEKSKQRNKQAVKKSFGVGLFASLLTGNIASAVSIPVMMKMSTSLGYENQKDQIDAMKQNELYSLEFYTSQAVDTLDHIITVIMPYLISETNRSIFNSLQELYQWYIPMLGKESMKTKLFNEISELYLYKQLPMNENTVKTRQELLYSMHQSHSDVVNQILELKG